MSFQLHNILIFLLVLPLVGILSIFFLPTWNDVLIKKIALFFSGLSVILSLFLLSFFNFSQSQFQFYLKFNWISNLNFNFILGIDGISLFFILLTNLLIFKVNKSQMRDIFDEQIETMKEKFEDILNIMHQTADWQLANPWRKNSQLDWHWGAFYTGLRALYEVTGEDRYKNEMINIGQSSNWKPIDDIFHADRVFRFPGIHAQNAAAARPKCGYPGSSQRRLRRAGRRRHDSGRG